MRTLQHQSLDFRPNVLYRHAMQPVTRLILNCGDMKHLEESARNEMQTRRNSRPGLHTTTERKSVPRCKKPVHREGRSAKKLKLPGWCAFSWPDDNCNCIAAEVCLDRILLLSCLIFLQTGRSFAPTKLASTASLSKLVFFTYVLLDTSVSCIMKTASSAGGAQEMTAPSVADPKQFCQIEPKWYHVVCKPCFSVQIRTSTLGGPRTKRDLQVGDPTPWSDDPSYVSTVREVSPSN